MSIGKVWIYRLLFVCFCLFVRLRISPPRIKLATSNYARRFIGVHGRESPILGNFAPPEAQNRTNRLGRIARVRPRHGCPASMRTGQPWRGRRGRAHGPCVGSACVDIPPSPKTDVLVTAMCALMETTVTLFS